MKSLIVLYDEKEIYISVKLEEVAIAVESQKESNLVNDKRIYKNEQAPWWNTNLLAQNLFDGIDTLASEYKDYKWFFDFDSMKTIHNNALNELCVKTKDINKKYILHYDDLEKETADYLIQNQFEKIELKKESQSDYEEAFFKEFLSFIKKKCTIDKVNSPTGEIITNYVNLKEAFENREYLLKISYLLSSKIVKKIKGNLGSYSLFCHTLNGACLAENLSLMLGINLLYADKLNTTGKMRKIFMPDHIESQNI